MHIFPRAKKCDVHSPKLIHCSTFHKAIRREYSNGNLSTFFTYSAGSCKKNKTSRSRTKNRDTNIERTTSLHSWRSKLAVVKMRGPEGAQPPTPIWAPCVCMQWLNCKKRNWGNAIPFPFFSSFSSPFSLPCQGAVWFLPVGSGSKPRPHTHFGVFWAW